MTPPVAAPDIAPPQIARPPLVDAFLGQHPRGATALISGDERVSFGDLSEMVRRRARELDLGQRSMVVLAGRNDLEWVVTYLALLADRHVPLLAAREPDRLADAWGAALVDVERDRVVGARERHDLHPDLSLLLSTSGSTANPKLVRLSHDNVISNARAIAQFQRLTTSDIGITTLPLHYCFGLSVLHSHLAVGASVVVTDNSVVDACFAESVDRHRVTNIAGVPHTYELLERAGAERLRGSSLRLFAQAGGRMPADDVRRWVALAERWDAEFMVMYGQTEATARMAYMDPDLASKVPGAIGRPIPGGSFTIEPRAEYLDEPGQTGVGELVYEGPNVMLGYAEQGSDLSLGRTVQRLNTGDLARYDEQHDVYEIVGRSSRIVKPFGVRLVLDDVQQRLQHRWPDVHVAGDDERLAVVAPFAKPNEVLREVVDITGLPRHAIGVIVDADVPRLTNGKVDDAEIRRLAADRPGPEHGNNHAEAPTSPGALATTFSAVLGGAVVTPSDSFVSLGGDSLSYVELSIRLERALGKLPGDWHLMSVDQLERLGGRRRSRLARLDTSVLLRAIGICMVVATHMRVEFIPGGAHTMLAVAGYNAARFLAPIEERHQRIRAGLATAARAALPTLAWIAVGMAVFGAYSLGTLLLVNNYVGPSSHRNDYWHFWFIEVFVGLTLLTTAVLASERIWRFDRRWPLAIPLTLLAAGVVLRLDWAQMDDWYNMRYRTHSVMWFFALGWLIHRCRSLPERCLATVLIAATMPGFFDNAYREWRIAGLLILLVWFREVPMLRPLVRPIGVLAAASMWIYISHFSIWPVMVDVLPRNIAYVTTIVAGVAVWFAAERLLTSMNTWRHGRPPRTHRTPALPQGAS